MKLKLHKPIMLERVMWIGAGAILVPVFAEPFHFNQYPFLLLGKFIVIFPLFGIIVYYYRLK
ncbi:MAG: hypothetical protein KKE93_03260 [Nanoarchaeota archaeon]|nr:hypothetical protein [Nanoarchaeota archaeon]